MKIGFLIGCMDLEKVTLLEGLLGFCQEIADSMVARLERDAVILNHSTAFDRVDQTLLI